MEAQPRKSAVFYGLAGLAVMAALLGLAYAFYTIGAWRAAEQAPKADNTVIITARSETTQPPTSQPAPTTDAPVKSVNVTTAGPSASASSPPSSYPFTTAQTPGRGWIQSVACPVTDDGKDCVPCCNYPGDILTKPPACQCYTKTPYRN
ncbi:MAG: hypothetical protein U0271_37140 [Polyangiaceae bacterium]